MLSEQLTETIRFGDVILALKPADPVAAASVPKIALDRSTPSSPHYGHYLTMEQVNEMTAPAPSAVASVLAWAERAGATAVVSRQGATVTVTATVGQIATMFNTNVRCHLRYTLKTAVVQCRSNHCECIFCEVYARSCECLYCKNKKNRNQHSTVSARYLLFAIKPLTLCR